MKAVKILKLFLAGYAPEDEDIEEALDELNNRCCNNCSTNYQRCRIFISYWKSTETNTVEDSKCFYCMKHKFKELKQ